jgi:hypothetical protein
VALSRASYLDALPICCNSLESRRRALSGFVIPHLVIHSMAASIGERSVLSMIASRPPSAAALKGRH